MLKVDHVNNLDVRKIRSHRMTGCSPGDRIKYIRTGGEYLSTNFAACLRLQCRSYMFCLSVDLDFLEF